MIFEYFMEEERLSDQSLAAGVAVATHGFA
jgi:hypothetical protein